MKHTTQEPDKLLEKLIASTRSPRGKFSAAASYPLLEKRLFGKRTFILRIASMAATLALLCVMSWWAYNYMQPATLQTVSTLASTQLVRLPDGTEVTLNHFSSLTYPEKFKTERREVKLNGEAYFEVSKDKRHPFVVQTDAVSVEVLGTHFNVEAYPGDAEVKTTLLEGSVAVSVRGNDRRMILSPNESAIYNKVENRLTLEESADAPSEIVWRRGEFVFNRLPLQEIMRQLSNSFGTDIIIRDKALQDYRLTARFSVNEGLGRILELLSVAGDFSYSQDKNQIVITTKSIK